MVRKRAIRQAFGAASRYEDEAHVQRDVADKLASHIRGLGLPSTARILEIGCGTGFLTQALQRHFPSAEWTVTDLSPDMVARCRAALGDDGEFHYLAMDGERPCFADDVRFDLICSSLAFQWFDDLKGGVDRLTQMLSPGGCLAFTTMADNSFHEWRAAHERAGQMAAVHDYPSADALRSLALPGVAADVFDFHLRPHFGSARAFLHHLRAIGAYVPKAESHPLTSGALRQVMRGFEAQGGVASYHIACCTFRKQA